MAASNGAAPCGRSRWEKPVSAQPQPSLGPLRCLDRQLFVDTPHGGMLRRIHYNRTASTALAVDSRYMPIRQVTRRFGDVRRVRRAGPSGRTGCPLSLGPTVCHPTPHIIRGAAPPGAPVCAPRSLCRRLAVCLNNGHPATLRALRRKTGQPIRASAHVSCPHCGRGYSLPRAPLCGAGAVPERPGAIRWVNPAISFPTRLARHFRATVQSTLSR